MNACVDINHFPCGFLVTDLDGHIMQVNTWMQNRFSISQHAELPLLEGLLTPSSRIFLYTYIFPLLTNEGSVEEIHLKMRTQTGATLPVLVNASRQQYDNVDCYNWVIFPTKSRAEFEQKLIQQRKEIESLARQSNKAKKLLRSIIDGVKDVSIVATAKDGEVLLTNLATEDMFQAEANRIIGSKLEQWIQLSSEQVKLAHPTATQSTFGSIEFAQLETHLILPSGKQVDVEVSARLIDTDSGYNGVASVIIITDIAKRKHYQTLQENFLANTSHELRTPLTSMLGALKLLNSETVLPLTPKAKQLITMTETNAVRLKLLVNDILDLSKLTVGKMAVEMRVLKVKPLLEQAIAEQQYYMDEKGIKVELKGNALDALIQTDAARFAQVMSNLLSNAKKFSEPGDLVSIHVEHDAEMIIIEVRDTGPGVSESFRPSLFEQFRQENSSSNRRYQGTGLGLCICKQLVHAMSGEIGYTPNQPKGAIFWFKCPVGLPDSTDNGEAS